eukprot:784220_1
MHFIGNGYESPKQWQYSTALHRHLFIDISSSTSLHRHPPSLLYVGLKQKQTAAAASTFDHSRRKESLERKIDILSFASSKIDKYKSENESLRGANLELNEINSELKDYIEDKNDLIISLDRKKSAG